MKSLRLDEIGYWSEVKLDIIRKYAAAYSRVISAQPRIKRHIYIDAFAGAGHHVAKRSGQTVSGSPTNALQIDPPFKEFHFIDLDRARVVELERIKGARNDVFIHEGDCNRILLRDVFPLCRYEEYRRALCLLDPYKLNVRWEVPKTAGDMRSIEVFYNFMIMDANMNVLWRNPVSVNAAQKARMTSVWGDESWRQAAYVKGEDLFGEVEIKAANEDIAQAFRNRLEKVAGFKYVPEPMPMRNSRGAVIYYLFFASPNATGASIVKDIFAKYRSREG